MPAFTTWHGTNFESRVLDECLRHNCECKFGLMGIRVETCSAHRGLLGDQRWMDGLVFMRRSRERLIAEESRSSP